MEYKRLGNTGLKVSRLCLGTMVFGRWGNADHNDCVRIMHRAFHEGVSSVDTANRYGFGESEYATAWVLRHPAVTSAIVGPREMRHLEGALAAASVRIPDEHLARIDRLVALGTRV